MVITEVRSESFGLVTQHYLYNGMSSVILFLLDVIDCNACHIFYRRVWYCALSLCYACIRSSAIILIP